MPHIGSKEGELRFQRPPFQLLPIPPDPVSDKLPLPLLRTLPDLVHFDAVNNSDHVFCVQSSQSRATPGKFDFNPITYHQLGSAVEKCCSWLLQNVTGAHPAMSKDGFTVQKAPPVALFLESDVGLFIYIIALLALNVPCVLLSIRLNPAAVLKLLKETEASSVIASSRTTGPIKDALSTDDDGGSTGITMYNAALFDQFLQSPSTPNAFQYLTSTRHCVRENDKNVIILHSSGTTGLPKAIPLAHRYLLGYAACHQFSTAADESQRGINLSTLPLFHGFGVLAPSLALSVGKTVCFPPSSTIGNSSLVLQMIKSQNITSLMTVPTILEEIVQSSAAKELACLEFVVVGGGPIKNAVAETLHSNSVNLLNHFGATELGALAPIFRPDKSYDWRYLRLRTDLGLELKQIESPDGASSAYRLIGRPFGSTTDFELQDSVETNPWNPGREVKLMGRKDDLIVLATGEKVSPRSMEDFLEQDFRIKRAVVFGTGQFEVGVLLEPAAAIVGSEEDFVETIWPVILDANNKVDQHACITTKAAVLVKPPEKSIPLSDKGSPQRKEVYSVFDPEIRLVYDKLERDMPSTSAVSIDPEDPRKSFREILQPCLPAHIKPDSWRDDDDFVQLGMDSLQATRLRRILDLSFRQSDQYPEGLPLDFVYSNSSIQKLVEAFEDPGGAHSSPVNKFEIMRALSDKFSFLNEKAPSMTGVNTILLTGTTGNLGSHLLKVLSEHPQVPEVACLVRAKSNRSPSSLFKDALSGQRAALDDRGIQLSGKAWSKVKVLAWQPGEDLLGLREEDYHQLASTITHIFHGAWPMDFQRKLSSFESQIKAVHELITLAQFAHHLRPIVKPRVILASSIAVVRNYAATPSSMGMVPEITLHDPKSAPLAMGYAEAKWVCEQVMESAYHHLQCQVQTMIVRIGQLTGSRISGYWSSKEHFPALVRSSKAIGHLPDLHGTLSWLPVDQAARVITDLLLRCEPRDLVYHLENPVRQSWPDVCSTIEYSLGIPSRSRLPFLKWLEQVSKLDEIPSDLMNFFGNDFLHMSGGSLILDTKNCQKLSPTLRSTGAVGPKDIELYIAFWRKSGFLKSA